MSIFNPAERTPEEAVYCEGVDNLIAKRIDAEISNGKPRHAVYLIAKLFGMANNKVRLYSDHLEHTVAITDESSPESELDIYGNSEVVDRVANFLGNKDTEVAIVVENDITNIKTHPLYKRIQALVNAKQLFGKFEIRKLTEDAKYSLIQADFGNHFFVSDDRAYRLERDTDESSYKAQANFNNKETAGKLLSLFDDFHWKNSDMVFSAAHNNIIKSV